MCIRVWQQHTLIAFTLALSVSTTSERRWTGLLSYRAAALGWHSAERREAHASALGGTASKESIDAWKQADSDNSRHPREAVRRTGGARPEARKTRAGGDREMQRSRGR